MSYTCIDDNSYFYDIKNKRNIKILVFSWNTSSLRLNNSNNLIMQSEPMDFFDTMSLKISGQDPDIVIFGFQEDASPGSYFHSHLLIEEMPKLGFSLLKRCKQMGVGKTTYNAALEGSVKLRGLRVSIYIKTILHDVILDDALEKDIRLRLGNDGQKTYVSNMMCNKGAIISYIVLPNYRTIAIICAHLPFNSSSLKEAKKKGNYMLRQNELNYSNIVFNNILENAMNERSVQHVIYFGDLNYRLCVNHDKIESAEKVANMINSNNISEYYQRYDELKKQTEYHNIYSLKEGIYNRGPEFLPTAKMRKNRTSYDLTIPNRHWKLGKEDQRVPSWCDRILYKSYSSENEITCEEYNSFDWGTTMKKSDHQGVYAVLNLSAKFEM